MRLDSGICTIMTRVDVSRPGEKPRFEFAEKARSFYAELDFATSGTWTTQGREDVEIDARIRIIQDRTITKNDVVYLCALEEAEKNDRFEVVRAWHGRDAESGMQISDLSLKRVSGR